MRFDCQAEVRRQYSCRAALAKQRVHLDELGGSPIGFRCLRGPQVPPLQALPVQEEQCLNLAHDYGDGLATYHCTYPPAFQPTVALLDGQHEVQVRGVVEDPDVPGTMLLKVAALGQPAFKQGLLSQATAAATPQELDRKFQDCWYPIWNRDGKQASQDVFCWPEFLQHVPDAPAVPDLVLVLDDLAPWRESLRRMKPGRATGVCGCTVSELRSMSDAVLADLVGLFLVALSLGDLPAHLCKSTASCVPKVAAPQSMRDCRPITVCATIYRLFATTVTRQVLRQWACWLPPGLKGAIPGRSSRDSAICVELQVEQALRSRSSLMGFSVDLQKFFNKIPRAPTLFLLSHMGLPSNVLQVWSRFLVQGDRLPSIGGHLGVPIPSSNGFFEGDPMSILAQTAVNWSMFQNMRFRELQTLSFVDNWAWVTGLRASFAAALSAIQGFCRSLALEISWPKSFAWATTKEDRSWIRKSAPMLVPHGHSLALVRTSVDLGIAFKYGVRLGRGAAEARIQEGRARLARLERLPRALRNKAHLLRQSIWPSCFYGFEGHLLPMQQIGQLRTHAARAILGRRTSMSPFLTLALLFPFPLDPEVVLLAQSLRTLQRTLRVSPAMGRQWLDELRVAQYEEAPPVGPVTALSAMLMRRNEWVLSEGGVLKGPGHWSIDLHTANHHVVDRALHAAWCALLPARLRSRNDSFSSIRRVPGPQPEPCAS